MQSMGFSARPVSLATTIFAAGLAFLLQTSNPAMSITNGSSSSKKSVSGRTAFRASSSTFRGSTAQHACGSSKSCFADMAVKKKA